MEHLDDTTLKRRYELEAKTLEAAKNGDIETLKEFKACGGDLSRQNGFLLTYASQCNQLDIAKFLVDNGVDVHSFHDFPIHQAIMYGNTKVVEYLHDCGSSISSWTDFGLEIEHAIKGEHVDTIEKVMVIAGSSHILNKTLCVSAYYGKTFIVKRLIEKHGADLHTEDDLPLVWAASNGHLDTVIYLVTNGANVKAQNNSALTAASKYSYREKYSKVIDYLMKAGNYDSIDDAYSPAVLQLKRQWDVLDKKYEEEKEKEYEEKKVFKVRKV
jgi:ankyrin repeat protein